VHVQRFDPKVKFVVLIHPVEVRRRIATGRMSHLCLEDSHLIMGQDYTKNKEVNDLIADPGLHSVILYPGLQSQNLTPLSDNERHSLFPRDKKLTIFVIDGTWNTARKMIRQSQNLAILPRVCFSPEKPSNFRVRKQPHPACYSTIEAIHHTIDLLGESRGFDLGARAHDGLLNVFDSMVELQLKFIEQSRIKNGYTYRRERKPPAAGGKIV
jgi:DTW domain-containing protein YfiP